MSSDNDEATPIYQGTEHIIKIELKPLRKGYWCAIFHRVGGTNDRHQYKTLDRLLEELRIISMLGGYKPESKGST